MSATRLAIVLVLTLGCSERGRLASHEPSAQTSESAARELSPRDVVVSYRDFELLTPQPIPTSLFVAHLCRSLDDVEREDIVEDHGPHALTAISIYMNTLAKNAFANDNRVYPAGSVVVKVKQQTQRQPPPSFTNAGYHPNGIGGMIKRSAGFDGENGDWEYFYVPTVDGKPDFEMLKAGKLGNCIACHRQAKARDYVFGHWQPNPTAEIAPR